MILAVLVFALALQVIDHDCQAKASFDLDEPHLIAASGFVCRITIPRS